MPQIFRTVDGVQVAADCAGLIVESRATESDTIIEGALVALERRARLVLRERALGLICSVDWEKALPEILEVRFDKLPLGTVQKCYPALFVVRTTMVAANRGAAGHDNSLWKDVCEAIGLPGEHIALAYSKSLKSLAGPQGCAADLVATLPAASTTEHRHVMLANLHAILPAYAVHGLWSVVGQIASEAESTEVDLAEALSKSGATVQPIRFLGKTALENSFCKEYILDILKTMLWAYRQGLRSVKDDLVDRGVPPHLVVALFREQRIAWSPRKDSYECEVENYGDETYTMLIRKQSKTVPITPTVLDSVYTGPRLFSKRDHRMLVRPTKDELLGGLFVLLRDNEHRLDDNNGTHIPWSEDDSLQSLKDYSLYSISKGIEPAITIIATGAKYTVACTSDQETAYGDEGLLPPEISINGKRVYTLDPALKAPIGRLHVKDADESITVRRGDLLFAKIGKHSNASGIVDVPDFTAVANRIDGIRSFPRGVLLPGMSLETPQLCGPVVGKPVMGKNYHCTEPAMVVCWQTQLIPIKPRKVGSGHIDVTVAGHDMKVLLPTATWSLEEAEWSMHQKVGAPLTTPYRDQCQLSYLNVRSAGWPARLYYTYNQDSRVSSPVYLGSEIFRLDPACHIRDELRKLKNTHKRGPICDINIWIEYLLPHLSPPGHNISALLFKIQTYRDCPAV